MADTVILYWAVLEMFYLASVTLSVYNYIGCSVVCYMFALAADRGGERFPAVREPYGCILCKFSSRRLFSLLFLIAAVASVWFLALGRLFSGFMSISVHWHDRRNAVLEPRHVYFTCMTQLEAWLNSPAEMKPSTSAPVVFTLRVCVCESQAYLI